MVYANILLGGLTIENTAKSVQATTSKYAIKISIVVEHLFYSIPGLLSSLLIQLLLITLLLLLSGIYSYLSSIIKGNFLVASDFIPDALCHLDSLADYFAFPAASHKLQKLKKHPQNTRFIKIIGSNCRELKNLSCSGESGCFSVFMTFASVYINLLVWSSKTHASIGSMRRPMP